LSSREALSYTSSMSTRTDASRRMGRRQAISCDYRLKNICDGDQTSLYLRTSRKRSEHPRSTVREILAILKEVLL
jgi:hypothetical protein